MDRDKLMQAGRLIIEAIGEDPNREGLQDTPMRFAKMLEEQLEFSNVSNEEVANKFNKTFECDNTNMVILKDIAVFSHCEHHIALMYNMTVNVGYIPAGRVIGISKIARIADAVCKRLQIQERIGEDIIDVLQRVLNTEDIIVLIEGEHSCMTARGIKKPGVKTRTISCGGAFKNADIKAEFLASLK